MGWLPRGLGGRAGTRGLGGRARWQGPGGVETGSREGAGECGPGDQPAVWWGGGCRLPWSLNPVLEESWDLCALLDPLLVCGGFVTSNTSMEV